MARVAISHCPLLVKIGVSTWKAKRVPVGSKLAKLAVLAKARWAIDGLRSSGMLLGMAVGWWSESESKSEVGDGWLMEDDGSLCFSSDILFW